MKSPIKIGARSSKLALAQTEEILRLLGQKVDHEILTYKTRGDKDKVTLLTTNPGDDFFTDTIDEALLKGEIDVAVHSAKDVPQILRPGLATFALTVPIDTTDAWVSKVSWEDLPPGAKVGTSSQLREQQIRKYRPDLQIVHIRGTVEERLTLIEQGIVDGIIVASCALKRLNLGQLIRSVFPWEGTPLQGQLAVVGREDDEHLRDLFKVIDARRTYGKVTLVGAGPGDPDLITYKGIKALEKADCVFYDYLVDKNLLRYAPQSEHIYAGKRKGDHTLSQEDLSIMLKHKAMAGKNVVRLKGGDPLIFGRGADEIQYLSSYHIQVDVVPGVSSATGIPSSLGVPLTARGISSSVAFVSGHEEDEDKNGSIAPVRVPDADTIVFLMGLSKLKQITRALKDKGWDPSTPVLVVSKGCRIDEQIVSGRIDNIERLVYQAGIVPPALIIAGETARLYRRRPRKLLLHCGSHPELYYDLGRIVPWPMIDIKPVSLTTEQKSRLVEDFVRCDLITLTSPQAVEHFMNVILGLKSLQDIRKKVFAVIGRSTQLHLEDFGVSAEIISKEETAQGFFKALLNIMHLRDKKILFPRSSLPNPFLKETLENQGAIVAEWTIYQNIKPTRRPLPNLDIQGVIFTSPSTVKNFLEDYENIPEDWEILCKGPVTEAALKEAGYPCRII